MLPLWLDSLNIHTGKPEHLTDKYIIRAGGLFKGKTRHKDPELAVALILCANSIDQSIVLRHNFHIGQQCY